MTERASDKFFIRKGGDRYEEVAGKKVKIPGFEQFDTFIHRDSDSDERWVISEGKTGLRMSASLGFRTQREAIENVRTTIERVSPDKVASIIESLVKTALSPRYGG